MSSRKRIIRRLSQAAMFSAVRAIAAATGTGAVTLLIWWIHHH